VNKRSSVSFTEKQGQYLSFISNYMKLNGRPPAEADMQKYFGVTPPTAHQMVVRLESLGLIKRTPSVGRSIQLLVPLDEIPCLK
jgi:Mn-dependent DtxR family transcriptional regulator